MRMYHNGSSIRFAALFVFCGLLLGAGVWTEVRGYQLPDTGQTRCYDNNGAVIHCPAPGEPFYGQDAQYEGAQPAYQDNSNGTVTDLNTGLTWQQDAGIYDTWNDVISFCNLASFSQLGGFADWRIPERRDLVSIMDFGRGEHAINTDFFQITDAPPIGLPPQSSYWSSTSLVYIIARNPTVFDPRLGLLWTVNFSSGKNFWYASQFNAANRFHVRCARGAPLPLGEYIDNGNGTATDTITGLVWQTSGLFQERTWQNALAYCEGLSLANNNDWRLPNIRELESLVKLDRIATLSAIDVWTFTVNETVTYWSSSTSELEPDNAHTITFRNGELISWDKNNTGDVLCVRGEIDSEPEIAIYGNVDFGEVEVASVGATHTFRIENQGNAPLHLTGAPPVAIHGTHADDFTVTSQPDPTVDSGESTTFDILFVPTAEGLRAADVSIANNDLDNTPFNFAIQGSGIPTLDKDSDSDGIADEADNCINEPNGPDLGPNDQLDTDGDGIGNVCECGDFDGNGFVNTLDARLIQRCVTGEIACVSLCDTTGDGLCNTLDARLIQRFTVGQISKDALSCESRPL